MDSAVQVALIGVFSTLVATAGIILTAVINNRKERSGAAGRAVDDTLTEALDESVILQRMVGLMSENERKENTIKRLREENKALREENKALRADREEPE